MLSNLVHVSLLGSDVYVKYKDVINKFEDEFKDLVDIDKYTINVLYLTESKVDLICMFNVISTTLKIKLQLCVTEFEHQVTLSLYDESTLLNDFDNMLKLKYYLYNRLGIKNEIKEDAIINEDIFI